MGKTEALIEKPCQILLSGGQAGPNLVLNEKKKKLPQNHHVTQISPPCDT